MAAPKDLREFFRLLEDERELRRVAAEVDPDLEIAAVTDRVCKGPGARPALVFEKVVGTPFPVATNLFGSPRRISLSLGGTPDEIAGRIAREIEGGDGPPSHRLSTLAIPPRRLDAPPCRDVVEEDPDLGTLPALRNWPGDAGRFLTLPMVFTRHPETGRGNCGMYRVQIFDGKTATLHWSPGSGGGGHHAAWGECKGRMPVAIALGGPPALTWAASAPLPPQVDEVAFTGWITGEGVETARCLGSDLEVPASAEFVLEGYVNPGETRPEGPFGNHTGFYALAAPAPVFHLERITRRHNPVLPCTVVGPPPTENLWLARATERLFLPILRVDFPEIANLRFLAEGAFHGCALVAVHPEGAGRGTDLIRRLWEGGLLSASRLLVVVDAQADLVDGSRLLWRLINQVDPGRDMIVEGGRLGIDGTEKEGRLRVTPDPSIVQRILGRWEEFGID